MHSPASTFTAPSTSDDETCDQQVIPVVVRVKVKVNNAVIEEVGSVDKAKAKICATMTPVEKIFKDSGFDPDIVCIRLAGDAKHANDTFKGNLDDAW